MYSDSLSDSPVVCGLSLVWNILTHSARINRKFQGIGEFIATRQERRLYYNDIINGFIVKCIIVTVFLSIACDRIFNKRR